MKPVTPETGSVLLGLQNRRVHDEVKLTKALVSSYPNIMETPGEGFHNVACLVSFSKGTFGEGLKRILGFVGLRFTLGEGYCIIYIE